MTEPTNNEPDMSHYYSDEYLKTLEGKPLDIHTIPEDMPREEVPQWLAKIVLVRAIEKTAQILEQLDHPEVADQNPISMSAQNVNETVFVMMDMVVGAMFASGPAESTLKMIVDLVSDHARAHGIMMGINKLHVPSPSKTPH